MATRKCLSRVSSGWNSDLYAGLVPCDGESVDRWQYDGTTKQVRTTDGDDDDCLDVSGGTGPKVTWYGCHNVSDPRVSHQQFVVEVNVNNDNDNNNNTPLSFRLRSISNAAECVGVTSSIPNDSGTSLWFPDDDESDPKTAYAVATFGELRGGNLSLVSSEDLSHWKFEAVFLWSRPGMWDDGALSVGPSPQRLSNGNWLSVVRHRPAGSGS